MPEIEFIKMSGAGNDFIAINNMDGRFPEAGRREIFSDWCRRGHSIGADGVIMIEPSQVEGMHFRMRYYNADGGEAETCGNGSRCLARFAYEIGVAPNEMKFETLAGTYQATVLPDERLAVNMSDAKDFRNAKHVDEKEFVGDIFYINTGVPHAVVIVDNLEKVPVEQAGKFLRYHPLFQPQGANINFAQKQADRTIAIRTYERGVEAETLACGTGSIAGSIIMQRLGVINLPVDVITRGGELLTVDFTPTKEGAVNVRLTGPAKCVFRGVIRY